MRRRTFITLLGGAAAWPLAARAQQREQMRRIGVLMNLTADDAEGQGRLAAFMQGLQEADWSVGGNVRVDLRWVAATHSFIAAMRRNWSRLRPMSFSPPAPSSRGRCKGLPEPYRSCSRMPDFITLLGGAAAWPVAGSAVLSARLHDSLDSIQANIFRSVLASSARRWRKGRVPNSAYDREGFVRPTSFAPITISSTLEYRLLGASPNHAQAQASTRRAVHIVMEK